MALLVLCVAALASSRSGSRALAYQPGVAGGFIPAALTPSAPPPGTGGAPAAPLVLVEPPLADSWFAWRRTPTRVRVVAPGRRVLHRWDADVGEWAEADPEIVVPEGRRTLHLAVVGAEGGVDWRGSLELKVDLGAPKLNGSVEPAAPEPAESLLRRRSVTVRTSVVPQAGPTLTRLGGRDRYETSVIISKANFSEADTVIIATGEGFADALAASGLAGSYRCPLLLTRRDRLPAVARDEMLRLGAKKAVIAGGPPAVSEGVAKAVRQAGLSTQRIGGSDRYETAVLVAKELERREGPRSLGFVARGDTFPDALAVSPFAYGSRSPILLVKPTSLPKVTRNAISRGHFTRIVIAGGPPAVSEGAERWIAGHAMVVRAGGSDRYETAVRASVLGRFMGSAGDAFVGVATGGDFPDALCGGVAAGGRSGVVLLTRRHDLPQVTGRAVSDLGPSLRCVQVYGGPPAVDEPVLGTLRTIIR
ncbi:MAG: cell wall-binding repeat-containing protein [Coriobacteriia bacterium]|nr:cell wall-binding repeat-containing protein [Coriobacteriia bacterium]